MRTAKTSIFSMLQKAFSIASKANKTNAAPADEILGQMQENAWTRRKFLENTGKFSILAATTGILDACNTPKVSASNTRIAIVGGGIAGLHAAHILAKGGIDNFTIYEAADRIGGRMFTAKNIMGAGLTTELGGEFIDSGHEDMFNLANEFGFTLFDTQSPSELLLTKDAYYFNGQHYSLLEVINAFSTIAPQMQADIDMLPDSITYNSYGAAAAYDTLSISQYLTQIGASGWLRSLIEVAYETEYGLSCDLQSAINMLFLISADTSGGTFDIFGESDERYKIAGGSQQVTDVLASKYNAHIEIGKQLLSIHDKGSYFELVFSGISKPVKAEYVILAIPFSVLRNVYIDVKLPTWKRNAIEKLGYGTNAKLAMGFSERTWRNNGYTGYVFANNGIQSGWDNSQLQGGIEGGYTVFLGGQKAIDLAANTAEYQAQQHLFKLDVIFTGSFAKYNNKAARFNWHSYQHTQGSYSCYLVGQWTSIAGAERTPVGRLYFAGEHCSLDYQGYMNGAAETGRVAAEEILVTING